MGDPICGMCTIPLDLARQTTNTRAAAKAAIESTLAMVIKYGLAQVLAQLCPQCRRKCEQCVESFTN